jgi:hypothetical protein
MAWKPEQNKVPTAIDRIEIILRDINNFDHGERIAFSAFDVWEPLDHTPNSGSVVLDDDDPDTSFTEDVDFSVDYTNGAVMVLSGGAALAPAEYRVTYQYRDKQAFYNMIISDQNGEILKEFHHRGLEEHLTGNEKTSLSNFLDSIRSRAETELL